jgi:hypothetical protein
LLALVFTAAALVLSVDLDAQPASARQMRLAIKRNLQTRGMRALRGAVVIAVGVM